MEASDPLDIRQSPAPPYVISTDDRERWELAGRLAERLWALYEDGSLDPQFYWMMQRSIYDSDIPTGQPEDAPLHPAPSQRR